MHAIYVKFLTGTVKLMFKGEMYRSKVVKWLCPCQEQRNWLKMQLIAQMIHQMEKLLYLDTGYMISASRSRKLVFAELWVFFCFSVLFLMIHISHEKMIWKESISGKCSFQDTKIVEKNT